MRLLETIDAVSKTKLCISDLRYCLVNENKLPFKLDGSPARSNLMSDFISFDELISGINSTHVENFAGVGISVQASNICAIDIDHCFTIPFDIVSADERAKDVIDRFKDIAYIEFSFSGTGLRVLFKADIIDNYSDTYYIKNESRSVEYYQPTKSYRYVTVTGKTIYDNEIKQYDNINVILRGFLNNYMIKPVKKNYDVKTVAEETRSYEELMRLVKVRYFKDMTFQNLWFNPAPGSGSNESERDYHLVAYLYENITQNKELLKRIFESSPFFKSKDYKHVNKWTQQEGRYFNYLYDTMRRIK